MGIGATIKNMMRDENTSNTIDIDQDATSPRRSVSNMERDKDYGYDSNPQPRRSDTSPTQSKLPAGTGPGTTGKPASEVADYDRERTGGQDAGTGFTEDTRRRSARRSTGDRLVETVPGVRASDPGSTAVTSTMDQAAPVRAGAAKVTRQDVAGRGSSISGHTAVLEDVHEFGHTKYSDRDAMPSGVTQEDTNQLNPVTHETVRHIETEEIQRVRERDRHIHHVQYHIQPVIASEVLAEEISDHIQPTTNIREIHANKVDDNTLFDDQVRQQHDTLTHSSKERTVIDKGTTVSEHTHHHVHHVIQPIIEKETIDRRRIRTTIPINEVTHEAPVVHQPQIHAPVPIEHFLQRGGALRDAVSQDEIGSLVLHTGQCTREVDGLADSLEKQLNINEGVRNPDVTTTTHARAHTHREDATKPADIDTVGSGHKPHHTNVKVESDVPVSIPIA